MLGRRARRDGLWVGGIFGRVIPRLLLAAILLALLLLFRSAGGGRVEALGGGWSGAWGGVEVGSQGVAGWGHSAGLCGEEVGWYGGVWWW